MIDNSKVIGVSVAAIVAMFVFMPTQQFLGQAGTHGLEYRFIWDTGIVDDGRAIYEPHVWMLAVQIMAVVAIAGLKIAANRAK